MAQTRQRPLSPHLTIWKWGPHMLVSILHRVTGDGMAIIGGLEMTWWLYAIANGPASYANFLYYVWEASSGDLLGLIANLLGRVVLIGLTWAFFQHACSGLRHFVLDMGAGYELQNNKRWSRLIVGLSVVLTAAFWIWIYFGSAR